MQKYNWDLSIILGAVNVSDNAIKKWCISYRLPSKSKELEKFINNI